MQNELKVRIASHSVTKDPNDKNLILDATGNVGLEQVSIGFGNNDGPETE